MVKTVEVKLLRAIFWGTLTRSGYYLFLIFYLAIKHAAIEPTWCVFSLDKLTKSFLSSITLASVPAERMKTKLNTFPRLKCVYENQKNMYVDIIMLSGSVWLISGNGGRVGCGWSLIAEGVFFVLPFLGLVKHHGLTLFLSALKLATRFLFSVQTQT